jgi:hypothetical protein
MPTPLKCPRCKHLIIQIVEHYVSPNIHYQNIKGAITLSPMGADDSYVIKRACTCLNCGHEWNSKRHLSDIGIKEIVFPSFIDTQDKEFTEWLRDGKVPLICGESKR